MGETGLADGVGCLSVSSLLSPSISLPLCWLLTSWHHRLSTALSPSSWALQDSCWFPISLRNQSMSLLLFFLFIFVHLVGSHWPSRPLSPPEPHSPWSFYLRPSHIDLARSRAAKFRRADNKKFTFSSVKKAVTGPLFYCFVILYVASVLGQGGYNCMSVRSVSSSHIFRARLAIEMLMISHHMHTHTDFNLWLKSLTNPDGTRRWSVAQINAIPIGGSAIAGTSPPPNIRFLVPSTTSYASLSTIPYAKLELILTRSGNDLDMGFHLRLLSNTMDPHRHSSWYRSHPRHHHEYLERVG